MGYLDSEGLKYFWSNIKKLGGSSPNLLINNDFRNPVNRNGLMEYTATGITIDKWISTSSNAIISVTSEGLIASKQGAVFRQTAENKESYIGKILTCSALMKNGGLATVTGLLTEGKKFTINCSSLDAGIYAASYENEVVALQLSDSDYAIAAKLELGDHQTLAHQNADGEWEIIDPPNYYLQYLLCSQYDPVTGYWVGLKYSNPNLLDNWYFAKSIVTNQRGEDTYVCDSATTQYIIDRWFMGKGLSSVVLTEDGLQLNNNTGTDQYSFVGQRIEFITWRNEIVTLSALVKGHGEFNVCNVNGNYTSAQLDTDTYELVKITFRWPSSSNAWLNTPAVGLTAGSATVLAAKLELGPVQTLAHKEGDTWVLNDPPPNKALELAKCQRYQVVIGGVKNSLIGTAYCNTSQKCYFQAVVPVPLRASPAIQFVGNIRYVTTMPSGTTAITYSTVASAAVSQNLNLCSGNVVFDNPILPPGTVGWIDTNDATAKLIIDANL